MFIPTNPNDRHQTDMEYQEWQRQRDAKKDDFPVIALNKQEFSLLKKCDNDYIQITNQNRNSALRLRDLDFIKIIKPIGSKENDIECCSIRERGRNYLRYNINEKTDKRKANWHDWKIAIFSSLAGAFFSNPLWSLLHMIAERFQSP